MHRKIKGYPRFMSTEGAHEDRVYAANIFPPFRGNRHAQHTFAKVECRELRHLLVTRQGIAAKDQIVPGPCDDYSQRHIATDKRRRRAARQMAGRKSRPGKKSQKRHRGGQDITIRLLKEKLRARIGAVAHELHEITSPHNCYHELTGPHTESPPAPHPTHKT